MSIITIKTVFSWLARVSLIAVLFINLNCALSFLIHPEAYLSAYELTGAAGGVAALQGVAVAFIMWNTTYPLVIINPYRFRALYAVVLAQQAIGVIGESYILFTLGTGHAALVASLTRFIIFDTAGLILMATTFTTLLITHRQKHHADL